MTGVRVEAGTRQPWPAVPARAASDRRRVDSLAAAAAVGVAAVVLPFVVVPAWYDAYYWPKVCVLYAAVAAGALSLLRARGGAWIGDLGAPLRTALAAWLATLVVATALSVNPMLSLVGEDYRYEGLLTWLAYAGLAAVSAGALRNPQRLRPILGLILAAAGIMSAITLLQHVGVAVVPVDAARINWGRIRAFATTGSPIALGGYLVLLLPLAVALYTESRRLRRLTYGTLVVAVYAALVATEARAAWGALALGLAVWTAAAGKTAIRGALRSLLILGAACAAVTPAVLATAAPAGRDYVMNANSAPIRVYLWRTSAPLVAERPWFGWGPDTLAQTYPAYGTPEFVHVFPAAAMQHVIVDRPHNDLLQQAIAAGLVGLAAYLWFWYAVFAAGWKTARARGRGDHGLRRGDDRRSLLVDPAVIGPGLLGGLAAYFAQLQLSFSYASVAPVFWVLLGAMAALRPRVVWAGSPEMAGGLRSGSSRV